MTLQESKAIIEEAEKQIQEWQVAGLAEDAQQGMTLSALSRQVRQAGIFLFHEGERAWSKRAIDLLLDLADVADGIEIAREPEGITFQTISAR